MDNCDASDMMPGGRRQPKATHFGEKEFVTGGPLRCRNRAFSEASVFRTCFGPQRATDIGLPAPVDVTPLYSILENAIPKLGKTGSIYFRHPEARYFAVDLVTRDQIEDNARLKGMPQKEVERWLAPNLAYEAE